MVVLTLFTVIAYADSLNSPFIFDGVHAIRSNDVIRGFWPPTRLLQGNTRPVAFFSFAVNYALHGTDVWGYHATNLAIHLAAGFVLFDLVRRTLAQGRLAERYAKASYSLALTVACLWLVHPLQTQSVTYIYQRFESLAGLFYLLTVYTFIRAHDSRRQTVWYAVSFACFLLGVGTKEVVATVPLIVVCYDRAFFSASWREALMRHREYYLVLSVILLLGGLFAAARLNIYRGGGILEVEGVSPWQYALSQPGVILHYLRLVFWPQGQCLDYQWPVATTAPEIVFPLLLVVSLLVAAVWMMAHGSALGLLGVWFFGILAPTSSFVPIRDLAFEHRMYLPLAAVIVLVVVVGYELGDKLLVRANCNRTTRMRALAAITLVVAVGLAVQTFRRNQVYASEAAMWQDVVTKVPTNGRAHCHLANALRKSASEEAIRHYRLAVEFDPACAVAHNNLGNMLRQHPEEAITHYRAAIDIKPEYYEAYNGLGNALARLGHFDQAIHCYETALQINPNYADSKRNWAIVLQMKRQARQDR